MAATFLCSSCGLAASCMLTVASYPGSSPEEQRGGAWVATRLCLQLTSQVEQLDFSTGLSSICVEYLGKYRGMYLQPGHAGRVISSYGIFNPL